MVVVGLLPTFFSILISREKWKGKNFSLPGRTFQPKTKSNTPLKTASVMLVSDHVSILMRLLPNVSVIVVTTDGASTKMEQNNVFTVAKRKVDGQDMVYQSLKFTNGLWALAELKIKPGSSTIGVSQFVLLEKALHTLMRIILCLVFIQLAIKSRATDVIKGIYEAYNDILHN